MVSEIIERNDVEQSMESQRGLNSFGPRGGYFFLAAKSSNVKPHSLKLCQQNNRVESNELFSHNVVLFR